MQQQRFPGGPDTSRCEMDSRGVWRTAPALGIPPRGSREGGSSAWGRDGGVGCPLSVGSSTGSRSRDSSGWGRFQQVQQTRTRLLSVHGFSGAVNEVWGGLWAEDGSESSEGGVLQLGHLGALGQQRSGNWDCRDLGIGIAEIWGHWDSGNLLPLLLGGSGGGQDTQCLAGEGVGMSHGWSRGEVGAKSTSLGPHPSRGHTSLLLLLPTS